MVSGALPGWILASRESEDAAASREGCPLSPAKEFPREGRKNRRILVMKMLGRG